MKNLITSILLCITLVDADLSVGKIEKMVSEIHQKRDGIELNKLKNTKNPFVSTTVEEKATIYVAPIKDEIKLSLDAILNEKAFINGRWHKKGDVVMGYTLQHIGTKGVLFRNENSIKKLFLNAKKENYISID